MKVWPRKGQGYSGWPNALPVRALVHFLTYVPPALALLLLGAYLLIGVKLTCHRPEPSLVDCLLEEYRWLGLVQVQESSLKGLRAWRQEFGDVILVAQSGEAVIPGRINSFAWDVSALDKFLVSTEPTLTLDSTPDWFLLVPPGLLAAILLGIGLSSARLQPFQ